MKPADTHAQAQEQAGHFAAFVMELDEGDLPVVLWDDKFVTHAALLAEHHDIPGATDALERLLKAVAACAH
jgi:hypothetical protein